MNAKMAQRGSIYVLIAFGVSALSLMITKAPVIPLPFLHLDYILVGGACGVLCIGALLFFPFAFSLYRLEIVDEAIEYVIGILPPKHGAKTAGEDKNLCPPVNETINDRSGFEDVNPIRVYKLIKRRRVRWKRRNLRL